jgi:hypothetical protein
MQGGIRNPDLQVQYQRLGYENQIPKSETSSKKYIKESEVSNRTISSILQVSTNGGHLLGVMSSLQAWGQEPV